MKFGAKRDPLLAQLGFFRAKFHSKSLYSVEIKIVGISQYAYFSTTCSRLKRLKKIRKIRKEPKQLKNVHL
jgi:hypothetical protein